MKVRGWLLTELAFSVIAVVLAILQPACVVAGYRSDGGGWFFWPGGVGLLVMAAVALGLFFLSRRRR